VSRLTDEEEIANLFKKKPTKVHNHHTLKSNNSIETETPLLSIFPKWRMFNAFPWQVWAVGWLAIFKGVLWLATDPNIPNPLREVIGSKNLLLMLPFVISGIGIWNLRKWAVWGMILLCVVDLLFFIVYPQLSGSPLSYAKLIQNIVGKHFFILQFILLLCNGPLGDIFILFASTYMLKEVSNI
jgi:hypothetical protein